MSRDDEIDVSVVMPVLNGEKTILEQLTALAAQDFGGSWELIISDNGSTDDTAEIVRQFRATAPMPVRLADATSRRGVSHARNTGVLAARGRVIAFCDCDDRAGPGWVSAAVAATEAGHLVAGVNQELRVPHDPESNVINPEGFLRARTLRTFIACNFALTRADYLGLGGFDESLPPYGFEDTEFAIRASEGGMALVGSPEMVMYYRSSQGRRGLLRKVYLSAKAEAVLWSRHPHMGQDAGIGRALAQLARLLLDLPRLRGDGVKRMAREVITRWGRLVGVLEVRLGRTPRGPRLIGATERGELR